MLLYAETICQIKDRTGQSATGMVEASMVCASLLNDYPDD